MRLDYELHVTAYVMQHFPYLMTDVERAAADAVVLTVVDSADSRLEVTLKPGTSTSITQQARDVLREGMQAFRKRTRERIVAAHADEVFANKCKCGKLPATPRAKMCIWCSYSWREKPRCLTRR